MPDAVQDIIDGITESVGPYLPRVAGAIAILLVGWIIALIASRIVRRLIGATPINQWVGKAFDGGRAAAAPRVDMWAGTAVFWLIILLAVVAALEALGSIALVEPLNDAVAEILDFIPNIVAALILLFIAWLIASILRGIVRNVVVSSGLERRLSGSGSEDDVQSAGAGSGGMANLMGDVVFWVVIVLFLPAILGALEIEGLLTPTQEMVADILGYLPNILGAALIFVIGWLVAKLLRRLATSVSAGLGADRLSERLGLASALGEQRLSGLIGLIVYVLVLIPVLIAGLTALKFDAVTEPSTEMLGIVFSALPSIVAASLVLIIAYLIGKIIAGIVTNLAAGAGLNSLPGRLGLDGMPTQGTWSLASILGMLVLAGFMLLAALEASEILSFDELATLIRDFVANATKVLVAVVILAFVVWLARLAAEATRRSTNSQVASIGVRVVVIAFGVAIALRQLGIANEIIILAFGLPLAAVSVAVAIAFGFGGREAAGRELAEWQERRRRSSE